MAKKVAKKKEKEIISKSMLVDKIASSTDGITKKDIAAVVNAFMSTVVDTVRQGDEVGSSVSEHSRRLIAMRVPDAIRRPGTRSRSRPAIPSPLSRISDFENEACSLKRSNGEFRPQRNLYHSVRGLPCFSLGAAVAAPFCCAGKVAFPKGLVYDGEYVREGKKD